MYVCQSQRRSREREREPRNAVIEWWIEKNEERIESLTKRLFVYGWWYWNYFGGRCSSLVSTPLYFIFFCRILWFLRCFLFFELRQWRDWLQARETSPLGPRGWRSRRRRIRLEAYQSPYSDSSQDCPDYAFPQEGCSWDLSSLLWSGFFVLFFSILS